MNKLGFSIIVFGLVVMVIAANFLSETLNSGLCPNTIKSEFLSPDKSLKAVVFARDCSNSAKAGNVSVLTTTASLPGNKPGNVLVQEGTTTAPQWSDDHTLVIRYDPNIAIQSKSESVWIFRGPLPELVTIKFEKR